MKKFIPFIIFVLIFSGCEEQFSDDSFLSGYPDTYVSLMIEGWELFQAGTFVGAIDRFQTAADRDATKPEPYLGLGWSYARSESHDLERAISNFQKTQNFALFDPDLEQILINESNAGLAMVYFAMGEFQLSSDRIQMVLDADPEFQFRYDPGVNLTVLTGAMSEAVMQMEDIDELYVSMVEDGVIFDTVFEMTGTAAVIHTDSTVVYGIHEAVLREPYVDENDNCIYDEGEPFTDLNGNEEWDDETDIQKLVHVSSGVSCDTELALTIRDTYEGTQTFKFWCNPILEDGSDFTVTYKYAENYGSFIDELLENLSNQ